MARAKVLEMANPAEERKPKRRKTDTRKIRTSKEARVEKVHRYLKAAVYNANKLGETKLVKQLYATGWVPEGEDDDEV